MLQGAWEQCLEEPSTRSLDTTSYSLLHLFCLSNEEKCILVSYLCPSGNNNEVTYVPAPNLEDTIKKVEAVWHFEGLGGRKWETGGHLKFTALHISDKQLVRGYRQNGFLNSMHYVAMVEPINDVQSRCHCLIVLFSA